MLPEPIHLSSFYLAWTTIPLPNRACLCGGWKLQRLAHVYGIGTNLKLVVLRHVGINCLILLVDITFILKGLLCHLKLHVMGWLHQQSWHEFLETCHSVTFYFIKKDSKRCCDTTTPESIHTKDESKRSSAFAFIFGVN